MADIQVFPSYDNGFEITMGLSARTIVGNAALLNRFQITFFNENMIFLGSDGRVDVDTYGGTAMSMIGNPRSISDINGITVSISAAISKTEYSIKSQTPESTPSNEVLKSAEIYSVGVKNGVITVEINVYPVSIDTEEVLRFSVPIISI